MTESTEPTVIPVGDDYEVLVGRGLLDDPTVVTRLLPTGVSRVLVVHPAPLSGLARRLGDAVEAAGARVHLAEVPDAESAKTAAVAADLWGQLGRAGFTRTDAVIGLGGGTVTDLAGFVAATWLRGSPSCRCRPPCWPWSTRPWAARPGSTRPRARTSSARSTRRPGWSATSTCWPRCLRSTSPPGWPRWSSAASSPTR